MSRVIGVKTKSTRGDCITGYVLTAYELAFYSLVIPFYTLSDISEPYKVYIFWISINRKDIGQVCPAIFIFFLEHCQKWQHCFAFIGSFSDSWVEYPSWSLKQMKYSEDQQFCLYVYIVSCSGSSIKEISGESGIKYMYCVYIFIYSWYCITKTKSQKNIRVELTYKLSANLSLQF